ncbi:MAG: HEAT repeat domain-containing protein [Planctomycetota bacterium]
MRRIPKAITTLLVAAVVVGGAFPAAFASKADEKKDEGPTEEEVEAAVAKIEKVLDEGSFEDKVKVLVEVRTVQHEDVAKEVAKAIKDDAKEVRTAAVQTLGYLKVDSSLKELTSLTKKKKYTEDEDMAIEIYKSIGRHGSKKSLKVLEDDILNSTEKVLQTRILAIGHVRDDDSVELLIGLMNKMKGNRGGGKGGPGEGKENIPNMQQFRLALHVLTGADEGLDRRDWQRWWNDNKHDLDVTDEYPELDKGLETQWKSYWGEGDKKDRKREREDGRDEPGGDRGEDPGAEPLAA